MFLCPFQYQSNDQWMFFHIHPFNLVLKSSVDSASFVSLGITLYNFGPRQEKPVHLILGFLGTYNSLFCSVLYSLPINYFKPSNGAVLSALVGLFTQHFRELWSVSAKRQYVRHFMFRRLYFNFGHIQFQYEWTNILFCATRNGYYFTEVHLPLLILAF